MKAFKLTVIACSLAVCAGCTMAPKYERPAAPVAATFPTGEALYRCQDDNGAAP